MAATVADACGLPPGARFLVSFFFAVTIQNYFPASNPVRQERGNVAKKTEYAIKIFKKMARGVHLVSSPGARPSGRFTIRAAVNETIDLRAGDVETA
jgi:hypothetical protein